jgi:chaperone modulatory protein CbpM
MTASTPEPASLLDDSGQLTLSELTELSGLPADVIRELAEAGLLEGEGPGASWTFRWRSVTIARRACRLRTDFDLNESGTVLALTLLQRIELLEARLRELECRIPR